MPISYKIVVIAVLIGVLPVFAWVALAVRNFRLSSKSVNLFLTIFFWGVLTAIPASILEIYLLEVGSEDLLVSALKKGFLLNENSVILSVFVSVFFVALIEELSKGLAIFLALMKNRIRHPNEGMFWGMLVGLAFGVTENGVYFASGLGNNDLADFISIVLLRFLISTSAHIVYSGIFGLFLSRVRIEKIFLRKVYFVFLAFFIPILIHLLFNFALETGFSFLVIFIIFFGFLLLYWRYNVNNKQVFLRE